MYTTRRTSGPHRPRAGARTSAPSPAPAPHSACPRAKGPRRTSAGSSFISWSQIVLLGAAPRPDGGDHRAVAHHACPARRPSGPSPPSAMTCRLTRHARGLGSRGVRRPPPPPLGPRLLTRVRVFSRIGAASVLTTATKTWRRPMATSASIDRSHTVVPAETRGCP